MRNRQQLDPGIVDGEPWEEPRPLPMARDLRGLAPGLTGGLPSEEWVRRLRDDRPSRRWSAYLAAGCFLLVALAVLFALLGGTR